MDPRLLSAYDSVPVELLVADDGQAEIAPQKTVPAAVAPPVEPTPAPSTSMPAPATKRSSRP